MTMNINNEVKCKKHGISKSVNGFCLECQKEDLSCPIYRIERHGNKCYLMGKEIPKNSYLNQYLWFLTDKNKRTISLLMSDYINEVPGIYGIFYKKQNGRAGECLYIGQSVNIKRRVSEHQEAIKAAYEDLTNIKPKKHTQQSLYYQLAFMGLQNLKFVQIVSINQDVWNNLSTEEAQECLAVFEQYAMDCYSPRLNRIAARKTPFKQTRKNILFATMQQSKV